MLRLGASAALFSVGIGCAAAPSKPAEKPLSRLELIEQRGALGCGVEPDVPGFSEVDAAGTYRGLDIDVCRAVAAAIFGTADKVRFIAAPSIADFLRNDEIDLVSRRLTWEVRREGTTRLLFGPITFYDAQAILVPKASGMSTVKDLAKTPVCVAGGLPWQLNLAEYFKEKSIAFEKVVLESAHDYADIAARLGDGRCRAYSGDLSDLAAIRIRLPRPDTFVILPERLSKEPLAPVLRDTDAAFFTLVRWTVFALIAAEELGVTSVNVEAMRASQSIDVQQLLGVQPGNGKALGLDELWAYHAIKAVGNYGEIFDRNLGRDSAIKLDRGPNQLWTKGGLLYAPPLR